MKNRFVCLGLSLFALLLAGCDGNDDDRDRFPSRAPLVGNAPNSIAGRSLAHTVTSGTPPFFNIGSFILFAGGNIGGTSGEYVISGFDGIPNSSGTYIYTKTGLHTATLVLDDNVLGTVTMNYVFDSLSTGTFQSTTPFGGAQTGTVVVSNHVANNDP